MNHNEGSETWIEKIRTKIFIQVVIVQDIPVVVGLEEDEYASLVHELCEKDETFDPFAQSFVFMGVLVFPNVYSEFITSALMSGQIPSCHRGCMREAAKQIIDQRAGCPL